jgi:predicted RecB family nuclease
MHAEPPKRPRSSSSRGGAAREPVVTASTLWTHAKCPRRLWLDTHAPGEAAPESDFSRDLRERAIAHERAVRDSIPGLIGPVWSYGQPIADAARETLRLLRESRAPLYQPVFLSPDGRAAGAPDLLYWDGDAPVLCDIKLAESLREHAEIPLQLTHYARLLEDSAGLAPARLEIVSGKREVLRVPRVVDREYEAAVAEARALLGPCPEPGDLLAHSLCEECPFYDHCWDRAERERVLRVLPGVWRNHVPLLAELGIRTWDELAAREPAAMQVKGLGKLGPVMVHEARAFLTGEPQWMAPLRLPEGRPLVWLDLEADTVDEDFGVHVYLWGVAVDRGPGPLAPDFVWSDGGEDRDAGVWRRFLEYAARTLDAHPGSPWVHYTNYEKTWIRKYVERHGDPDGVAARVIGRLYDLHAEAVMPSVRLPLRSYSIKHVAPHLGFAWSNPEAGSQWSVAQYQRARKTKDAAERASILAEIARYNADDLEAMRVVWSWLGTHAPAA